MAIDLEQEIQRRVREYEENLRLRLGLRKREFQHFKRPKELPFTARERHDTTILFGGLTLSHEHLIKGALEGLGYRTEYLPCPDIESLAVGKEYGNRGQCNPTYFTVGNLVKYLIHLREKGVKDIERRYLFITAGSCGPCRFGMYEAEYRKALRDAGFNDFRVLLFQQSGGLNQSGDEAGLKMDKDFFFGILKGMVVGDLLNSLGYKIRPYEIRPGETDRVLSQAREVMYQTFKERTSIISGLRRVKRMFEGIEVDFIRVKPKVKIIGEFWAQTTEGDGNYHLMRWLEEEGAEVITEPIGTWIGYLIWSAMHYTRERLWIKPDRLGLGDSRPLKRMALLMLAKLLFEGHYNAYRAALGFVPDPLPPMGRLARYAKDYYNTHLEGGEGHLEVGKNIMAFLHKKAHMVISVKPFGCMPSTQSDGVQSKVVTDFKDIIFIPIETSGDGEINVKSRIQMKLYEAKKRAREEFERVLKRCGVTLEEVRRFADAHPKLKNPMRRLPHKEVGTAANFLLDVAPKMRWPWISL